MYVLKSFNPTRWVRNCNFDAVIVNGYSVFWNLRMTKMLAPDQRSKDSTYVQYMIIDVGP